MSVSYHRHTFRRPSHDYAGPGAWLVTLKCFAGRHSFGEVMAQRMVLNEVGALVHATWRTVPEHHPNVRLDSFVVMPNHMHMIVRLSASDDRVLNSDRSERFGKPVPGSLATVIRSFKSEATRQVRLLVGAPVTLWQSRFDDRSLGDAEAIARARSYIAENPARWRANPPRRRNVEFEHIDVGRGCELAVPINDEP